jgi:chitinase
MARTYVTAIIILLFSWIGSSAGNDDFIIAGYLPGYRSYINVNNTARLLTDLILFSLEPDKLGALGGCCLEDSHYQLARDARAHKKHFSNKELKLWISIGGAGRSDAFSHIAAIKSSRATFIQNLISLCQKRDFDGIDLDWEQPSNKEEYEHYATLIVEAADALHKHDLLLSVTSRQVFSQAVVSAIDRIQFMGYDWLFEGGPKHHAEYQVVTKVVDDYLHKYHYPSETIVLGIPAYARHKDRPTNVKTFAEMVDDGMDVRDPKGHWNGYMFDSLYMVTKKVDYAKKNELGGVFLWELGHDKQDGEAAPGGWVLEAVAARSASGKNDEL